MAAAFQQQIFALDARFNAYRAPNNPSFSKYPSVHGARKVCML